MLPCAGPRPALLVSRLAAQRCAIVTKRFRCHCVAPIVIYLTAICLVGCLLFGADLSYPTRSPDSIALVYAEHAAQPCADGNLRSYFAECRGQKSDIGIGRLGNTRRPIGTQSASTLFQHWIKHEKVDSSEVG